VSSPILVGFCPDTADRTPVDFAVAAARFTGAPLAVIVVRPGGSNLDRMTDAEFHGADDEDARDSVEALRASLAEQGVEATFHERSDGSPPKGIAAAAEELKPRLLVVGSTRRGAVRRVVPGSTAERLIHGASCPIVVVPQGYERPAEGIRKVGAAFAPTEEGRAALRAAALLARAAGAELLAITVLSPKHAAQQSPGLLSQVHNEADPGEGRYVEERLGGVRALEQAIAELADGVPTESDVLFNDPADGIVAASRRVGLLVMGSRGYGPARAVMLGGVSRRVITQADCPTLVLPRGIGGEIDSLLGHAGAEVAGS
jgi:nucleotide-binding universal stress UspA family protein